MVGRFIGSYFLRILSPGKILATAGDWRDPADR